MKRMVAVRDLPLFKGLTMNAVDIMTPEPLTVRADDTLYKAVQLMIGHRVSGLPVVDPDGRVIGMLTEGDLLERAEIGTEIAPNWLLAFLAPGRLARNFVQSHGRRVGEVMTDHPVCITETTSLEDVVMLMQRKRIKRLPVVRDEALVGIVSRADFLRALAPLLDPQETAALGDAEIREKVISSLDEKAWAPIGIKVTVVDGRVDLDGIISDERTRDAIIVVAENVAGVKSVKDHLVWIEPNSGLTVGISGGSPL
ncbi:CBS domain-containing protein [Acidisoma sp. L85]|uniref:CBS domain-containing protein n=1 Tax=Acidisoma sp. L85 TaxID=1641850 RepID=UPI00131BA680|nr:CBS domain-containing protein [Acidisoma sp. L85]